MAIEKKVNDFFDFYRKHDVDGMVSLCTENARFNYVPFEAWGEQRVVRGTGHVRGIGKATWATFIDSFPDLSNKVNFVDSDENGNAVAEVVIGGRQKKPFGTIGNLGKEYKLPHVFVFKFDENEKIDMINGYWDGTDLYKQLGRNEID